jgi:acyl-CoA thioesterase-1
MCAFLVTLLFPINGYSDQVNTDAQSPAQHKLLVLGDSLSAAYGLRADQGWVSLLQSYWNDQGKPIEVINAAISGDTTDGGLARLPRLLSLHEPTHLYIELGGNNGLQGHNPKKIRENLAKMIQLGEQNNVEVILQEIQIPTNYGRRYTQLFTQNYHELAEEYNVPLIPFFLEEIALNSALMQNDGIHPTAEAQPMIVDFLAPKLAPLIIQGAN